MGASRVQTPTRDDIDFLRNVASARGIPLETLRAELEAKPEDAFFVQDITRRGVFEGGAIVLPDETGKNWTVEPLTPSVTVELFGFAADATLERAAATGPVGDISLTYLPPVGQRVKALLFHEAMTMANPETGKPAWQPVAVKYPGRIVVFHDRVRFYELYLEDSNQAGSIFIETVREYRIIGLEIQERDQRFMQRHRNSSSINFPDFARYQESRNYYYSTYGGTWRETTNSYSRYRLSYKAVI